LNFASHTSITSRDVVSTAKSPVSISYVDMDESYFTVDSPAYEPRDMAVKKTVHVRGVISTVEDLARIIIANW